MGDTTTDIQSAADLRPGDRFGDYTVRRLLGRGATGCVYLVESPGGMKYALKIVNPGRIPCGSEYRERFINEAEFAMSIRHPNLIAVHDAGENSETGVCYILMDYMPGGSLSEIISSRGALSVESAVSVASQIALALDAAHRRGVIHRDVKPDNILFAADGSPRLTDLGVAKFATGTRVTMVTSQGMIVGTPAYMAPEQLMDSHEIDARADIYSLGVVLHEMLTGKMPRCDCSVMGMLAKAVTGEPLPDVRTARPEVSAAVALVLSAMCAPNPCERPQTAGTAADLLVRAGAGNIAISDIDGFAASIPKKRGGLFGWLKFGSKRKDAQ